MDGNFRLEIRKKDGSEYVPNTLHHIVAGVMRYIRLEGNPSIDFFKDAEFANFRLTLDGEMKRLSATDLRGAVKKPEYITVDEEEFLWSKAILGDHSQEELLNTMNYILL